MLATFIYITGTSSWRLVVDEISCRLQGYLRDQEKVYILLSDMMIQQHQTQVLYILQNL